MGQMHTVLLPQSIRLQNPKPSGHAHILLKKNSTTKSLCTAPKGWDFVEETRGGIRQIDRQKDRQIHRFDRYMPMVDASYQRLLGLEHPPATLRLAPVTLSHPHRLSALQMRPWHIQLGIKDLALRLANARLHLPHRSCFCWLPCPPNWTCPSQPQSCDINSNLKILKETVILKSMNIGTCLVHSHHVHNCLTYTNLKSSGIFMIDLSPNHPHPQPPHGALSFL